MKPIVPHFNSQKVRARQIVVADGEEAIQILKRLKKGESFEKVAKEKSLGPEKVNGGDLGYFSQGERPTEFDHVFTMEVGAISEVIKSPYGYHIFKLEEKMSPGRFLLKRQSQGSSRNLDRRKERRNIRSGSKGSKGRQR